MRPIIYRPKGAAREYAPLAANLYQGCTHKCRYCYVPGVLRKSRQAFHSTVEPKPNVVGRFAQDLQAFMEDERPKQRILLCFACDPYPPTGSEVTRRVLEWAKIFAWPVSILTKAGRRAERDFDLLEQMDAYFGVSLSTLDASKAMEWEPGAASPKGRLASLAVAQDYDIPTWVSMEPVIWPQDALELLDVLADLWVDWIWIGKLNHMDPPEPVDWRRFVAEAQDLAAKLGITHKVRFKESLKSYVEEAS